MQPSARNKRDFELFAVCAWKNKNPNLRRVVDLWLTYLLEAEGVAKDLKDDPASRLIIALLAYHTGMGIHDKSAPQQATDEIQNARH
jgi:hypothetical protein